MHVDVLGIERSFVLRSAALHVSRRLGGEIGDAGRREPMRGFDARLYAQASMSLRTRTVILSILMAVALQLGALVVLERGGAGPGRMERREAIGQEVVSEVRASRFLSAASRREWSSWHMAADIEYVNDPRFELSLEPYRERPFLQLRSSATREPGSISPAARSWFETDDFRDALVAELERALTTGSLRTTDTEIDASESGAAWFIRELIDLVPDAPPPATVVTRRGGRFMFWSASMRSFRSGASRCRSTIRLPTRSAARRSPFPRHSASAASSPSSSSRTYC